MEHSARYRIITVRGIDRAHEHGAGSSARVIILRNLIGRSLENAILVLVAEDEPLILELASDALETGGFSVISVSTGADAVSLLDARAEEIAGVVTDIRLGDQPDGWEVARHARSLCPTMPVVYTTGDSAADWPVSGVPNSVVVQKPYAPAQLVTAISMLLTASRPGDIAPPAAPQ